MQTAQILQNAQASFTFEAEIKKTKDDLEILKSEFISAKRIQEFTKGTSIFQNYVQKAHELKDLMMKKEQYLEELAYQHLVQKTM